MNLCILRRCGIGAMVVAFAMCLLIETGLGQAADDKLTLIKDGKVIVGHVKKEDMDSIEVDIRDPKGMGSIGRKFALNEVAEIEWDISDTACVGDWREGVSAFKKGEYNRAAECFNSIISDKEVEKAFRAEAKPCLYYMYAESLYRAEKLADAQQSFATFMKNYQLSTYMPLVVGSLVDMAIKEGKFEQASKMLADLRRLGGEQKALADYYEGKLLRAKNDIVGANKKFSDAVSGSSNSVTKGFAMMGQADCAVDQKDFNKARELAQKILSANPPDSVAGAAHLVIGNAIMSEIDSKKPVGDVLKNMLLDAVLEYLRVHLQYKDRHTEPQALFKAGECFQMLAKKFQRGIDHQRAIVMYTTLKEKSNYRATEWCQQADKALKKINR